MAMFTILKKNRGLTLIELMVALVISTILIAAIYRTFIRQQKTYTVQEQVVDMQQNARVSISRMMDEIRMAGFGNISTVLPVSFGGRSFANIVNLDTPAAGGLTIISAIGESAVITGIPSQNQIVLSRLADDQGQPLFDMGGRRYISVGGLESYTISAIDTDTKTVTLNSPLKYNHVANRTRVFGIRALTYQVVNEGGTMTLEREDHTGGGPQPVADDIEHILFEYLDAAGNPVANPPDIRRIRVAV
ncbi:MAG: prepilin-type N-terminal cleavage/methylation domain-containing protein, partial [Deltaproteobacteria bacterium]